MKEEIIERKDGVTVHMEIKRGSGTRDQDKISGTVHAENMEIARGKAREMRSLLTQEAVSLRNIQPDPEPEESDK